MWMFGSRTTVKKVRNSLTWFSQELGCIEDHCVHWYHQSVWNEFASIESCMEVGSTNTTFTEKFGGIDINVEVPSEVNDELTGLASDHSQLVEGMKTEVRQLESLKVGKDMTESDARKVAKEKGVKILTSRWVNTQKTPTLARCRLVVRDFASGAESAFSVKVRSCCLFLERIDSHCVCFE